jgi:antitoxin component YwqK of YwqJK toxin-antitoxin module
MKNLKIIALLVLIAIVFSACTKTKVEYFEDGSVKSSIPYRFGKENGLCKYYFINAPHPLKIEVEMRNGKRHGNFTKYYINGRLETRCTYQNDLLEGVEECYHIKGYRTSVINYLHGKKHGQYVSYYPNGEVVEQGCFYEDLFDGDWFYYDDRGVLIGEGHYEKGTGVQKGYNLNGNLIKEIHYKDNKKNGEDIELDNEGDTIKITVYKDDRIVSVNGKMVVDE